MPDRIYKLASVILASGQNIRPSAAIAIAIKFIELLNDIEQFKHDQAQTSLDC
jgi:hypothetical protein